MNQLVVFIAELGIPMMIIIPLIIYGHFFYKKPNRHGVKQ